MASIYKGYMGKMLDINLTTGKVGEYQVSDRDRELFLGGRYLSTKILWDELKPGIDPLSEENVLVVMTSPLTGSGGPCTSRYDISAKSPQTGCNRPFQQRRKFWHEFEAGRLGRHGCSREGDKAGIYRNRKRFGNDKKRRENLGNGHAGIPEGHAGERRRAAPWP